MLNERHHSYSAHALEFSRLRLAFRQRLARARITLVDRDVAQENSGAWGIVDEIITACVIAGLIFVFSGCASMQAPSIMDQLHVHGAVDTSPTELSDLGILRYANAVLGKWNVRSLNTEYLATGGAISVAALSTGALAAAGNGAASGITTGLAAGVNFLLQVLGILKPDARANAFSEGGGLILDAQSEYLIALTTRHIYHVPTDRVTPAGAVLLSKINSAVKVVSRAMVGLLPRYSDMEKLQPVDPATLPEP